MSQRRLVYTLVSVVSMILSATSLHILVLDESGYVLSPLTITLAGWWHIFIYGHVLSWLF